LSGDSVRALAQDARGDLWVGTEQAGLVRLGAGEPRRFRQEPGGLPSDRINALLAGQGGALWVGTDGSGLARWRDGRWTLCTTREGLGGNSISYLLEDGLGHLWIGSSAGLMQLALREFEEFAAGRLPRVNCRTYGREDGLPTKECTRGFQPAAWRGRDGHLWFATIQGLVTVDPTRLAPNTNPPPVVIESVLVEGQPAGAGDPAAGITIPAGKQRIEVHYASLNLSAPRQARFRYRLEGHDRGWTEVGDNRTVSFFKLEPGRYQMQVTACNEDGLWNPVPAQVALTVLPPFWRTWWFLTATAVAVLGLIVAAVHFISTQRLQRQVAVLRQQEALERERKRIARDIHDQLGANLTQVALLGELVEADKNSPADIEDHARQICRTARETTRSLDEIVWTVNPANDTLEGLANYLCKYAQEYLAVASLRCRLDVPAQLPAASISPDVRHNVFLAAREAVTNIVRHARASSAWLRLRLEPGRFTFEIEDDGRGPGETESERAKTRNGLRNMARRMEDVGGAFSIGPAPERGTLVRLTAPLKPPADQS
jgi:signal transduction histidine kinase